MPENSLEVLLDIYNEIWSGGDFPSQWREATIIPIPKAGKISQILVITVQLLSQVVFVKRLSGW